MPLTAEGCRQRREKLLEHIDADQVVISNPRHVLYLSGYWVTPLHIGGWGSPHLIIERSSGTTTLLTHNFAPNTHTAHVDQVESWHWYDAATAAAPPLFPTMATTLHVHLRGTVAIERGVFPHDVYDGQTIDITDHILTMRRHKYADEHAMLRACVRAVEAGHRAARTTIQAGVTEIDVYNAIYAAIVAEASEPVLPLGDFASGERAHQGGGAPTPRKLQAGEVMIVDLFPVMGGYRADFTATYAVSDTLTDAQKRLETALHVALTAGESRLKAGMRVSEIYQAVKSALAEHGYAGAFPHHAGHGLGLGHPEAPYIVPGSEETLQVGDVVTLEPGAYGDGFGGRIEHNYAITADGYERLSNHNTRFV